MIYPQNQRPNILTDTKGKDTGNRNDLQTIFLYLQQHTATNTMVSLATGIPQKSICRYKRDLEQNGQLYEVEKRFCKVTGKRAWYLTTNPRLFPETIKIQSQ